MSAPHWDEAHAQLDYRVTQVSKHVEGKKDGFVTESKRIHIHVYTTGFCVLALPLGAAQSGACTGQRSKLDVTRGTKDRLASPS